MGNNDTDYTANFITQHHHTLLAYGGRHLLNVYIHTYHWTHCQTQTQWMC